MDQEEKSKLENSYYHGKALNPHGKVRAPTPHHPEGKKS
jgi:hypothetical protein